MPVNTPNNQPLLVGYGQSQPLINIFESPIVSNRNPGVNDRKSIGALWVNKSTNTAFIETSVVNNQANWLALVASGGSGVFASLTVNPGPINLTGVLTQLGTANINTSGTASSNIGTGSNTGTVSIGNASSTAVSILGPVSINTAGTAATNIGNASGNTTIAAGNLTITNGNLSLGTLGNKLNITTAASGTNASAGTTAAMAAGTIVVANTAVTAASIILVSHATAGGTMGQLSIGTITPGVNFAILTDNVLDISTVNFLIIN